MKEDCVEVFYPQTHNGTSPFNYCRVSQRNIVIHDFFDVSVDDADVQQSICTKFFTISWHLIGGNIFVSMS